MTLNDKEYNIIVARIIFKSDFKRALIWLKAKGHEMSQGTYYKTLAVLDQNARNRLHEIACKFETIAADEIVKFQNIEKQMWEEYYKETNTLNRARILQMIANLQPYITALYDQTREVLEGKIESEKDSILSINTER